MIEAVMLLVVIVTITLLVVCIYYTHDRKTPSGYYRKKTKTTPDECIPIMYGDIVKLVDEIIRSEKPNTIIQLGGKSAFLIRAQENRLKEKRFQLQILRKNRIDDNYVHAVLPKEKPAIIVVDSIHGGNEICDALKFLYDKGVGVRRIYCFLAAQEGLKKMMDNGFDPSELVRSLYEVESETEYEEKFGRLSFFFHAQIEPMDQALYYDTYDIDPIAFQDAFRDAFQVIFKEIGNVEIDFIVEDPKGFPSEISMMTSKFEDYSFVNELVIGRFPKDFKYIVNYVQICIKVRKDWASCKFTVMADTDVQCDVAGYGDPIRCKIHHDKLCDYSDDVDLSKITPYCYQCAGQIISDVLLGEIRQKIFKIFKDFGFDCRQTETSR